MKTIPDEKSPKKRKERRIRLPFHVWLTYLLICTLLATGVSSARYVSTSTAGDSTRTAVLAVNASSSGSGNTLTIDKNNQSAGYSFTVANEDNGTVCETTLQYDVIVELSNPLPADVSMELASDDGVTVVPDNMTGNTCTFSDVGIFEAGIEENDSYTLVFQTTGSPSVSCVINADVSVRAEQID
ncbi:MAG: hypothetical protein SOY17_11535 [Evtepia sp.]|nr:hypothetical protein [Evtepia sp.]